MFSLPIRIFISSLDQVKCICWLCLWNRHVRKFSETVKKEDFEVGGYHRPPTRCMASVRCLHLSSPGFLDELPSCHHPAAPFRHLGLIAALNPLGHERRAPHKGYVLARTCLISDTLDL